MRKDYRKLKPLATAWKNASPALRASRHADIRRQVNALAIDALHSLFQASIKRAPSRKSSGFVQMYKILGRRPAD